VSVRYLLDTNVLSEPIKSHPNEHTIESLSEHDGELATCSVVWHELCFGAARLAASKKRRAIETYLEEVVGAVLPILPYDQEAASWHARERARLSKRGRPPSAADGQIAAIAGANDHILVTANVKDFRRFKDLVVEDWSR
jgi:tRNA(fMet)-specific endonuclease VapC